MIGIFSKTYHKDGEDILIATHLARAFCFAPPYVGLDSELYLFGCRLCWQRSEAQRR